MANEKQHPASVGDADSGKDHASGNQLGTRELADQLADVRRQLEATRKQLDEMSRHALTDLLTGVGNRRAMEESLQRRLCELDRYGNRFSMLVIDLDRLKEVNDQHGHPAGDTILTGTASELCAILRRSDLVFRVGGDEFIVLLPGTDAAKSKLTADRLCQAIAGNDIPFEELILNTTVSIGLAQAVKRDTGESLYHRADQLLYRAKRAGGNRCVWSESETDHVTG